VTRLTHVDDAGRARMVDVSDKEATQRVAEASGQLRCRRETVDQVLAGAAPKGSVIRTAEIAGIMAAKRTADLIPLCHPLPLTKVEVAIEADEKLPGFTVRAQVRTRGPTGVEMEALTAVSVACLTLFDMLKAIDRTMSIDGIAVVSKSGGKSGDWQRSGGA
jgi:cyclic pyranopterin monophosphate synthase